MKFKRKTMRIVSGMLTAITLFTNALSPVIAYAAPADEADSRIPYYEEIKDQLDQDEVVTARDIEVTVGSGFDVKADFSGIEIPDSEKAKVKLMAAQNDEGKEFSTDHADIYKTVYSVEPQKTDHPVYQISRNITVKDVSKEADTTVNSDSSSDQDSGTGETEESEDSDDESETDSSEMKQPETDEAVNVSEAETETEVTGKEITEEEFDAEIESTENQETVDPETGTTLSEVMEEAVDQGIALNELEAGEMVTFEMPMLLAAAETGSQSVSITRGSWYHYADYGLGSYITAPYYVSWGGIKATAYCVQPSKNGPDDGTYSITKLSDGKTLAKVCYYGTKASDENGFFDEKHPDFSAGKRFIITHLAAAYANGSSDWDSGTNATGRSLAKELYNYCINMPDIPDVDMSFSDSDVNAYVEGNIQRTKTITFKADELQTITFKLPQGVKLVNVTTGKTSAAGASVEICGGTQFYLTAPLSQAEDVGALFSSKMKGSIDKEYSAYKITTGSSTQDLALVFGEGVGNEKYVDFKVTWTKECYISIVKKDSETSNTLAGAVYGIYSDAACTQLIKQMPATDANGAAKVTIEKTQEVVYLKEISVPTGYTIDAKAYNVTLNIGKTSNMNVTDKRVTATISLHKQDAETGNTPQGDATLEGAVYGLFAREDIVHPDGKTGVLYKKGTQITSLTTDKNGQASVSNLYLGKYYFKELTPPVGYLLDQEEHEVDCSYEGANVPVVERKAISKEDVIKQPFQIIKAANNGKTDADLLKGVGFSAWLASDLKVKADGSYDFSSANPVVITADGKTEMFTDEKGYACSIPLPYGTYVVKETTSKHNYEPVDDFIVTINDNHPDTPQVWRVLLDKEFEAKLKIIKKDDETKKSVLLANTEFKVYDLDHQKYVEQVTTYPSTKVHKSYFTDENGYLILPNNLKIGNYRIEEVTAPEGYTQSSAYVTVSVDTNTAYMIDPTSKDAIIEVEYENHPVKGELTIFKQGELLAGYDHDFQYELCGLKGVTFEVYAAEDIYTADHQVDENGNRTLYYAKDALVAKVTTDEDGYAYVKDLPLGEYYVKESEAPEGFVHNENSEKAVFVYADQNTPVVFDQVSFTNERQKVSISVEKQDADNGNVVPGAVFGIYNAEDIINKDGQVIVKADTLLQEMTSDEDGQAKCTLDLPLGQYYVKELHAPAGFVSSDEILSFDASYQGQDIQTVELKAVKKNEPTVVEITKSDITTGEELDGAYLQVLDQDGNIIDSWESSKDEPHVIKRLTVGETYILREEFAPYGYLVANDITFTIEDTAEIQKVEMKDEVPVAELILNKKGEFLDEVSLVDQIKGVVEHIFHYITGSLTDVTFEVYAEEDIKAADGVSEDYYKADELVATITTDETGIAKLSNLPLGKYYVKEVGTAHGYVLDSEIRHVDLSYVDQNTPVVTYNDDWQNHRQRVIINLVKKEKDQDRVLEGSVFGLYAKEDIKSSTTGKVLIEADEIIELKSTDAEGKITFVADLPIDAEYYVKELYAPAGFVNAEEVQEFTVSYAGENEDSVVVDLTFEDEATTVEITKTDLTGGKEIPGCKLKLVDEDGNTVDEWTSTEEAHVIKELVVGKKYTLIETQPADGYVTAESIEFTVENTAEIQKHQMKDDVTKVEISKQDIAGKELPGAKLTILDKDGKVVESWTSTKKAHYIEMLPIGKYTLREETAPDGYLVANDVEFEVKDTGEVQHVTMVDEAKPAVQADTPKTGDERNMKLWLLLLGIGAGGLGVAFGIRRKRK
ncbi:MAG: SpaA isopeptide-forming pilin-related protein [Suilimivivens sp.]